MRITVDPSDSAYTGNCYTNYMVFLDGTEIRNCITADDEMGLIIVHERDSDGNFMIDRERSEAIRQTLYGKVEIVNAADFT